jgi:hypothetical protein
MLALCSAPAWAFVCGLPTLQDEFDQADAVFMASVISNEPATTPQGGKYRRVRLRVVEQWKSDGGELEEVILSSSSGCSTHLLLNTTYIIFGQRYSDGQLAADWYSSTRALYWDGECPSNGRQCRPANEEAGALLAFLRRQPKK